MRIRLVSGVVLIGGSLWLVWTATTELIDSFTIYRGYEVGTGRFAATVLYAAAIAIGYPGVKLIRSFVSDRRHSMARTENRALDE